MDVKKEREGMKDASRGLFKEGDESKKFCKWCDKKLEDCEDREHKKKRENKK